MFKHLWFAVVIGLLGQAAAFGQAIPEPVKVPVKVRLSGGTVSSADSYASLTLADDSMDAFGINGKVQSTVKTFSLEVGKTYTVTVSSAHGGRANNLKVVGPPGYTMMLNGVRRTSMSIGSDTFVNVRLLPPDDQAMAPVGTATAFAVGQVKWAVSLGSLRGGTASAGWLRLVGTGISDDWTSFINAASLYYEDNADSVAVYNEAGVIRQISTPEAVVDVVTEVDANKVPTALTIKFYQPDSAVPVQKSSLKTFKGLPFVTYRITKTESALPWSKKLTITRDRREISSPTDTSASVSHRDRTTLQLTATSPAVADYRWVATPWTIDRGTPQSLIVSQWAPIANNGGHNEVLSVGSPKSGALLDGNLANLDLHAQSTNVHSRITSTSADLLTNTTSLNETGTFTYYNETAVPASYGFPKSKQSASGSWVFYAYKTVSSDDGDDKKLGTIAATYSPFVNAPATPPSDATGLGGSSIPAEGVYTTYDYAEDVFGMLTRLSSSKTYVNGMLTGSTHIDYTTAVANLATYVIATRTDQSDQSSGSVLTSVSKYYQENVGDDLYRNQPYAQIGPDGSKQSYFRLHGVWDPTNKVLIKDKAGTASLIGMMSGSDKTQTGATAQTLYQGHAIDQIWVTSGRSTLELVIRDERNRVVRKETQVWDGSQWQLVNWTNFDYDWSNRLVTRLSSNGDKYKLHYSAGVKSDEIDGSGTKVSYIYDDGDRVKTATKEGMGDLPAVVTEYTHDSVDHITQQDTYAVGHSSEKITTKRVYDLAGRLTSETVPAAAAITIAATGGVPADTSSATTSYAYGFVNQGGSAQGGIVTVTFPDASTRVRTSYLDGQLYRLTGSGVVPKFFTYGISSNGLRTTEIREVPINQAGNVTSANLSTFARYTKVTTDWLGRIVTTERPGFTGLPAFIESKTYSPTTGFLIKTDGGVIAPTLYEYDSLGQLIRSGLDLNNNGVLDLEGPDRISGQERNLVYDQNAWWLVSRGYTYATANSALPVTTGSIRQRLSGFTDNLRAETRNTDAEGNTTIQKVTVDRAAKLVQSQTTFPGVRLPEINDVVNGLPTQTSTTDGLTVTLSYDYLQRPLTVTDSRSNTITTAYYPGTTLPYSRTAAWDTPVVIATYGYDRMGRMAWTRNADDHYARTDYNDRGQVKQQWGDATYPSAYDYTDYGELKHLYTYQTPNGFAGETWPITVDTNGNPSVVAGSTTQWEYDAPSGLLVQKINKTADHADPFVRYDYNALGQVQNRYWARTLDGTANTAPVKTTYSYDTHTAELLGITYNDGTPAVATTYNRLGQPQTVTDATVANAETGSRTFLWDDDAPWRLNGECLPDFYQNHLLGRLYENVTDVKSGTVKSGTVKGRVRGFQLGTLVSPEAYLEQTLRGDDKGRITSISSARDNGAVNQMFTYAYTANSRLLESISANGTGFKLARTYESKRDLLGKISGTWTTGGSETTVSGYDYVNGNLGQRLNVTQSGTAFADYGEVTRQNIGYNERGELKSAAAYLGEVTATPTRALPGRNFQFGYDEIGNRTSVNHTGGTDGAETVVPNELNQIDTRENKSVSVSGTAAVGAKVAVGTTLIDNSATGSNTGRFWQTEVTLDNSAGPVAKQIDVIAAKSGAGDAGADLVQIDRRYLMVGRAVETMHYDADGNLQSDDHWLYTWDAENRLVSMQANPWTATAHGPARQKLEFKYDYLGRRVSKKVSNWVTTSGVSGWVVQSLHKFVYDGWNLIAETDADGNLLRSYTWGLSPDGSSSRLNLAGSLVQITDHVTGQSYFPTYDGNGNVVALVRAADGALAASYEYSPFGESLRQSGFYAAENPIRFSGKYTDTESGLVYYGHRYYEPRNGRFINRDPIEESGGLNLYGFVGNDPINREDLLGWWSDGTTIGLDTGGYGSQLTPGDVAVGGGSGVSVTVNSGNPALNQLYSNSPSGGSKAPKPSGFAANKSSAITSATVGSPSGALTGLTVNIDPDAVFGRGLDGYLYDKNMRISYGDSDGKITTRWASYTEAAEFKAEFQRNIQESVDGYLQRQEQILDSMEDLAFRDSSGARFLMAAELATMIWSEAAMFRVGQPQLQVRAAGRGAGFADDLAILKSIRRHTERLVQGKATSSNPATMLEVRDIRAAIANGNFRGAGTRFHELNFRFAADAQGRGFLRSLNIDQTIATPGGFLDSRRPDYLFDGAGSYDIKPFRPSAGAYDTTRQFLDIQGATGTMPIPLYYQLW